MSGTSITAVLAAWNWMQNCKKKPRVKDSECFFKQSVEIWKEIITRKHTVSKKHKIFFIKYTKFVKQNCITDCKLSNLTYYLKHIPPATQLRRKIQSV